MKHFQPYELVDKETYSQKGDSCLDLFTPRVLTAMDNVWDFFFQRHGECKITINDWYWGGQFQWRGWRTEAEADLLLHLPPGTHPGQEQHAAGDAFDYDIKGMTAQEVRDVIVANQDDPLLVGITRLEAGTSWVHMDCKVLIAPQTRIHVFIA